MAHNYEGKQGKKRRHHDLGNRYTRWIGVVSSWIGMKREAVAIEDDTDIFGFMQNQTTSNLTVS